MTYLSGGQEIETLLMSPVSRVQEQTSNNELVALLLHFENGAVLEIRSTYGTENQSKLDLTLIAA